MNRAIGILLLTLLMCAGSAHIATAQQQQRVDIKALFRMIPIDEFSGTGVETLNELEQLITVCDTKNGFLRLESKYGIRWEMCHWTLKNGDKLIGIRRPLSYSFYLYSNGKVTPTNDFGIDVIATGVNSSYARNCCDNRSKFLRPTLWHHNIPDSQW